MKNLCKMYHDLMEFGTIVGPVFTLFIAVYVSFEIGVLFDSVVACMISFFATIVVLILVYLLGAKEE